MADVDQIPIWRGALCEQQHAADMDQAAVEQRFGTIKIRLNLMPCHKEHSIEFNDFMIFQCCGAPFGLMGVVLTYEGNLYWFSFRSFLIVTVVNYSSIS